MSENSESVSAGLGLQQAIVNRCPNDTDGRLTPEFIERSVFQPDIGFAECIEQLTLGEPLFEAESLFRFDARTMVGRRRIEGNEISGVGSSARWIDHHRTLNPFVRHGDGQYQKAKR